MQIYIYIIAAAVLLSAAVILYRLKVRKRHAKWDDMDGHDFEIYCAGLLEKCGFISVEVTKASKDYGVDILAEKDGITYAFQCKCYNSPVGIRAVQEIYAGRDYYDRMVGVVMTNQYFTQPAVKAAVKLKILLWDRGYIEEMLEIEN